MSAVMALAAAMPSFKFVKAAYWTSDVVDLDYPMLGAVSRWVERRVEAGDLSELPSFFAEVERQLTSGDDYKEGLVGIEVVEALHHVAEVIPFLGPQTRALWNQQRRWFGGKRA